MKHKLIIILNISAQICPKIRKKPLKFGEIPDICNYFLSEKRPPATRGCTIKGIW